MHTPILSTWQCGSHKAIPFDTVEEALRSAASREMAGTHGNSQIFWGTPIGLFGCHIFTPSEPLFTADEVSEFIRDGEESAVLARARNIDATRERLAGLTDTHLGNG